MAMIIVFNGIRLCSLQRNKVKSVDRRLQIKKVGEEVLTVGRRAITHDGVSCQSPSSAFSVIGWLLVGGSAILTTRGRRQSGIYPL
jgi:hypothetical protein